MSHGSALFPRTLHVVPLRSNHFASLLCGKARPSKLARLRPPVDQ